MRRKLYEDRELEKLSKKICIEKTCPICKKVFYISDAGQYVYKQDLSGSSKKYFCSWTCFRKRKTRTRKIEVEY